MSDLPKWATDKAWELIHAEDEWEAIAAALVAERERCARVLSREADERGPLLQDDVTEILAEILLPDWPKTDEDIDRLSAAIRQGEPEDGKIQIKDCVFVDSTDPEHGLRIIGIDLARPGGDHSVKTLFSDDGTFIGHASDCPCPACQKGEGS